MIIWFYTHFVDLYKPNNDLFRLFLSSVSRRVSQTLVSVFSSVYIYKLLIDRGYESRIGVVSVLLFHCIIYLTKLVTMFIAENYSLKYGLKNAIKFSFFPFLISIACIIFANQNIYLILLSAFFWGIHAGFYWLGFHGYFVKAADINHFGRSIGQVELLQTIAAILSPVGGAFVVGLFGFNSLFAMAVVFMVVAILLLRGTAEYKHKTDVTINELLKSIKRHYKIYLAYIGGGVEAAAYLIIWPLFLYLILEGVVKMGITMSAAVTLAAVFGLVTGDITDKKGEKKLIYLGVPLVTSSWLIKSFLSLIPVYVLSDSLWSFGQKMVALPLGALTYKKASEKKAAEAIIFRETGLNLGALVGFFILILVYYFTESFRLVFFVVALISLLPLLSLTLGGLDGQQE